MRKGRVLSENRKRRVGRPDGFLHFLRWLEKRFVLSACGISTSGCPDLNSQVIGSIADFI